MRRAFWKKVQPRSLRHAMELCKDYAREARNLSVERIAEDMGQADHYSLYKWFQNGRMPAVLIPAFESACGINFVSRWLAARGGKLVIDMPTGRKMDESDILHLQAAVNEAIGTLIAFYNNKENPEKAVEDITAAIQKMAWHKGNVEQHSQPQLELESADEK